MAPRPITEPMHRHCPNWPKGKVVAIEKVPGERFDDLYDVLVGGEKIGQIEKRMGTHAMKIKGTRLSRGNSKPRPQWRPVNRRVLHLWDDTAGQAINALLNMLAHREGES